MTGTLPTEMGLLTQLEFFSVFETGINGTLPSEIALCTSLLDLDLWSTGLHGTVPEELYHAPWERLGYLNLGRNDLSGTISTNIGKLTTLGVLYLNDNNFRGTLPTEIGLLTLLETIHVDGSGLTGTIPQSLCDLRESDFSLHDVQADCAEPPLGENNVTMQIPQMCPLGCCTNCCIPSSGVCAPIVY